MRRGLKFFIMLPLFTMIWGVANSIGVTTMLAEETGLPDLNTWEIPGLAEVLQIRELTGDVANEAKDQARQAAVKAVKAEVRRRYGPEAAKLVPSDLNRKQARNFDFDAFGKTVDAKLPKKPQPTPRPEPEKPKKAPGTVYTQALATLATLDVKGKAPMTGYDRDEFGSEWSDAVGTWKGWSRNGCDTRNDVLKRDLVDVKFDGGDCDVASGTLRYEPYTGTKNYRFDSTDDEYATDLDIEHIVALGNVWVTGGFAWTEEKRALVANDPINLMAADPSSNRQKGDADFATWLPSNKSYRCDYAAKQIQVKEKYDLWVTPAEKSAMSQVLASCK